MTQRLSKELADALRANGEQELEVIDPATGRQVHAAIQRGIEDLEAGRTITIDESRRRSDEVLDAIAAGIAQMEAGQGKPLHEVEAEMRAEFGYPPRA